jgi:hypothetical protein
MRNWCVIRNATAPLPDPVDTMVRAGAPRMHAIKQVARNWRVIRKATAPPADDPTLLDAVDALVRAGAPRMDALVHAVARRRGLSKREVYAQPVRD